MSTTPRQAIRKNCVLCCGGVRKGINGPAGCNSPKCDLYPHRNGDVIPGGSYCGSIHAFCVACAGSAVAASDCEERSCPLWKFRRGTNPNRGSIPPNRPKDGPSGRVSARQIASSSGQGVRVGSDELDARAAETEVRDG